MTNIIQITPFMHVPDIGAAVTFFEDILGFETLFRMSDYAYLEREGAGIRMLQNHGDDGAPPGNRRFAYYLDVRDVDALYAELKPKLDTLPPATSTAPPTSPTTSANCSCSRPTAISSPSARRSRRPEWRGWRGSSRRRRAFTKLRSPN